MTFEDAVAVDDPDIDGGPIPGPSAPEPFQIVVRVDSDRCEMILAGELDMATAPLLRHRMAEVTDELGSELILDVRGLTFIDSTGLSLLVSQHKKLASQGSELIVLSPTRMARRLFAVSGLDAILSIRTEGDDALTTRAV